MGDEDLKREGQDDQAAAGAKRLVDRAKNKATETAQSAKEGLDNPKDTVTETIEEDRGKRSRGS